MCSYTSVDACSPDTHPTETELLSSILQTGAQNHQEFCPVGADADPADKNAANCEFDEGPITDRLNAAVSWTIPPSFRFLLALPTNKQLMASAPPSLQVPSLHGNASFATHAGEYGCD